MSEAVLIVRRKKDLWQDIARDYQVMVDGRSVASIARGQEVRIAIAAGRHTVQMKIDWCTSGELTVDAAVGEEVMLDCGGNAKPFLALLYVTIWKNKYLWLRPAQSGLRSKAAA